MNKYLTFTIRFVMVVSLVCAVLASCQSQETVPTTAAAQLAPTDTFVPPSPTPVPPTDVPPTPRPSPTPLPSLQVQTLQEITGDWKSNCGAPCLWRFKTDGTFEVYEYFQGPSGEWTTGIFFEWGKIALVDGVLQFISADGAGCAKKPNGPNGYYQVFRTDRGGKPLSLNFKSTQPDECIDRETYLTKYTLNFVNP